MGSGSVSDTDGEVEEVMALQAKVDLAPYGQVRQTFDGSIAYRTNKPRQDTDAWLIVRPDGSTIGAGHVRVGEMDPLLRWHVLT